jgi:hypothetical protein
MTGPINRRQATLGLMGLAAAAACLLAGPASATPAHRVPGEVASTVPGARLQGQARLRVLGFSVYDARLWSAGKPVGRDWTSGALALEIDYLRSVKGAQIADRSLAEMRKLAEIAAADAERWLAAMKAHFPDVQAGDRITGVSLPGQGARFFVNGSLKGEIADAEFARLFFGIWLSPRTSEPAMREALLGSADGQAR